MATTKSTTTTTTKKRKTTSGTKINVKADLLKIGGSLIAAILVAGGTKIKNDWNRKQELKSELKDCEAIVKGFEANSDIMDATRLELLRKRANQLFNTRLSESMRMRVNNLLERIRVLEETTKKKKEGE